MLTILLKVFYKTRLNNGIQMRLLISFRDNTFPNACLLNSKPLKQNAQSHSVRTSNLALTNLHVILSSIAGICVLCY